MQWVLKPVTTKRCLKHLDANVLDGTKRATVIDLNTRTITDEECRDAFAYNLSDIMKTRGFGQAALAEKTGLSKAMISKYINKQSTPTLTNLMKIAYALDCEPEELMD